MPASTSKLERLAARPISWKKRAPRRSSAAWTDAAGSGRADGGSGASESQVSRSSRGTTATGARRTGEAPAPHSLPHAASPERVR